MAAEVPHTLEYRGGQLNAAPMLEVENFTNCKKRFLCHIIGIEPHFKGLIENGPFILMVAGNRKPENQWTLDERKAANLDQGLKESELACLFGKLKYEENLIDIIYETEKKKSLVSATPLSTSFISTFIVQDFQDRPDDEEDTRSSQNASVSKSSIVKNKGHNAEAYEWDEEEVSSDENEIVELKVLMALANDENVSVGKESARSGEWVKISMRKVHTLLEMEDNDDRKSFLDYVCIDLNYVEEKRNNLLSKHINIVHELNTCKEQLIVLKQAKLDFLTMHHVNTEILKENQNLRKELKELTNITETWRNSYNKRSLQHPSSSTGEIGWCRTCLWTKDYQISFKSNSTFKAKALKGVTINEPSPAPAKAKASASKTNSAPANKLKDVKTKDDLPLARCERTDHRTCDHVEYMSTINLSQHLKSQGGSSSRSRTPRPSKQSFPPCIHCGFSDHLSDDCVNYPICDISGCYDHDTHGHNKVISLRRGIKPRNPQHVIKSCETSGSTVNTTSDHKDIEWFRRGEALQAKKAESHKSNKTKSSNASRSKSPTKRLELVVLETKVSSDQNDQTDLNDHNDQNDHHAQIDEIFNDNQSDHSNHNNDDPIIDNLSNIEDVQNPKPTSLIEDNSVPNIIPIPTIPSSSIPSMASLVPQDRWS
ncbi:hypothetical protein Tco_1406345 [Tanacetum coccineum]